jgi:heterodisulfide reductase subunit A-like polyferredoxin
MHPLIQRRARRGLARLVALGFGAVIHSRLALSPEDVGEIHTETGDVRPAVAAVRGISVVGVLTSPRPLEKTTTNSGGRGLMRQPSLKGTAAELPSIGALCDTWTRLVSQR